MWAVGVREYGEKTVSVCVREGGGGLSVWREDTREGGNRIKPLLSRIPARRWRREASWEGGESPLSYVRDVSATESTNMYIYFSVDIKVFEPNKQNTVQRYDLFSFEIFVSNILKKCELG